MGRRIVCGALFGAVVLAAAGPAAAWAMPPDGSWEWDGGEMRFTEFESPVDVQAVLDHGDPSLQKSFERAGVTVGEGAELDDTDLVSNPGVAAGAVEVDIDQDDGTITVTVIEEACVASLGVRVAYDGPTTFVAPVDDGLFGESADVELLAESGLGTFDLVWTATGDACVDLGPAGSVSTFEYALLILVYDDFGPGDPMPVAGSGTAMAALAALLLAAGVVLTRAAARRAARIR